MTKKREKINENEVELAERYVAALDRIDGFGDPRVSEDEVERAERYATALEKIENASSFTDADIERAEQYAAALEKVAAEA